MMRGPGFRLPEPEVNGFAEAGGRIYQKHAGQQRPLGHFELRLIPGAVGLYCKISGSRTAALRPPQHTFSPREHDMIAPIFLPALLVFLGTERLFFAIADGLDAIRTYALLLQRLLQ